MLEKKWMGKPLSFSNGIFGLYLGAVFSILVLILLSLPSLYKAIHQNNLTMQRVFNELHHINRMSIAVFRKMANSRVLLLTASKPELFAANALQSREHFFTHRAELDVLLNPEDKALIL